MFKILMLLIIAVILVILMLSQPSHLQDQTMILAGRDDNTLTQQEQWKNWLILLLMGLFVIILRF